MSIPVIDVFAGPGGLNEGFASLSDLSGSRLFTTAASFEMDAWACETLRLRATYRGLRDAARTTPAFYEELLSGRRSLGEFYSHPEVELHAKEAADEVHRIELGPATRDVSDAIIAERLRASGGGEWVLIGGPPCQAYSLAGRSRRTGDPSFKDDHKHVLYREYLHIIEKYEPAAFVMENVKGILSSQHDGAPIFERIKADLERPKPGLCYQIRSLVVPVEPEVLRPSDFVIKAEKHGIPQRRHRVILLGVRSDLAKRKTGVLATQRSVSLRDAIGDLPAIRSRVSPLSADSPPTWNEARLVGTSLGHPRRKPHLSIPKLGGPWLNYRPRISGSLADWLIDTSLTGISLHDARRHMRGDLERYAYLATMAGHGQFPKVMDLPPALMPNHRNAARPDAPFADRFRVQSWDLPSTTIVSHIAKDGHYYIHPDPQQVRSLTVREAARLQTFPDNYLFVGNRTQQYHQVGNAVPPLLARQIGEIVHELLTS